MTGHKLKSYWDRQPDQAEKINEVHNALPVVDKVLGTDLTNAMKKSDDAYQKILDDHKLENANAEKALAEKGLPSIEKLSEKSEKEHRRFLYDFNQLSSCLEKIPSIKKQGKKMTDFYSLMLNVQSKNNKPDAAEYMNRYNAIGDFKNIHDAISQQVPTSKDMKNSGFEGETVSKLTEIVFNENHGYQKSESLASCLKLLDKWKAISDDFKFGFSDVIESSKKEIEAAKIKIEEIEKAEEKAKEEQRRANEKKKVEDEIKRSKQSYDEIQKLGLKTIQDVKKYKKLRDAPENTLEYEYGGVTYKTTKEEIDQAKKIDKSFSAVSEDLRLLKESLKNEFHADQNLVDFAKKVRNNQGKMYDLDYNTDNKALLESYQSFSDLGDLLGKQINTPKA